MLTSNDIFKASNLLTSRNTSLNSMALLFSSMALLFRKTPLTQHATSPALLGEDVERICVASMIRSSAAVGHACKSKWLTASVLVSTNT